MTEKQNASRVEAVVKAKMENVVQKGLGTKVQVSTRVNIVAVAVLDLLADFTGESRTGLAADLLTAAIQDAGQALGLPPYNTPEFIEALEPTLRKLDPEAIDSDFIVTSIKPINGEQK